MLALKGMPMTSLCHRNALLTGASGGLGPYIARELAVQGTNLALVALPAEQQRLTDLAAALAGMGVGCVPIPADISTAGGRQALLDSSRSGLGPIDLLVNAAGIGGIERFCDYRDETISRIVDTNLTATLLLSRLVLPDMLARRQGHIVTLASMAGWVPTPYNSVYAATKAGLIAWTRALRVELSGTGVGASVVCPSYVSGAGMHARHEIKAPRVAREVPPERVARAVVRAVQRDLAEVLVTAMPIRPLLALTTLWPAFQRALLRVGGFYRFAEQLLVHERQKAAH
jgi:short-subunit dehydrogenase